MDIIRIQTTDPKWEHNTDSYVGKLLDGEKLTFKLLPYNDKDKHLLSIIADIYITNPDTDFILDISIGSIVQFDTDNGIPTTYDIFEIYCKARMEWNEIILKESINKGILINRITLAHDYDKIEHQLKSCISDCDS